MSVVRLADALDAARFGGKAVQLSLALRAGLPVPDGFALSWETVDAWAADGAGPVDVLAECAAGRWAVRSSAVGEDGSGASFAGTHLSLLGVRGVADVLAAVRAVHASGRDAGAGGYRERLGLGGPLRMGVVAQAMVEADVAGVMFTRNPITGADEIVVEASWGLGEAVVAGLVIPDRFVLDRDGRVVQEVGGEKDVAVRYAEDGGTVEVPVPSELVDAPCLDASRLDRLRNLALACDRVFGSTAHDIEFAFEGDQLFLLQRRPITTRG